MEVFLSEVEYKRLKQLVAQEDLAVTWIAAAAKRIIVHPTTQFKLTLTFELAEYILDILTSLLMKEGLDSAGEVNSYGVEIERYIDLFVSIYDNELVSSHQPLMLRKEPLRTTSLMKEKLYQRMKGKDDNQQTKEKNLFRTIFLPLTILFMIYLFLAIIDLFYVANKLPKEGKVIICQTLEESTSAGAKNVRYKYEVNREVYYGQIGSRKIKTKVDGFYLMAYIPDHPASHAIIPSREITDIHVDMLNKDYRNSISSEDIKWDNVQKANFTDIVIVSDFFEYVF